MNIAVTYLAAHQRKPRNTVSAESSSLGRQRGSIRFGVAEGDFSRSCRTNPRLSAPEFARFSLAISAFLSPGNGLHTTKRKVEMWSAMVCGWASLSRFKSGHNGLSMGRDCT